MAKEIATVITGEGIVLDETKFDQLKLAIAKTVQRFGGEISLLVSNIGNDTNDGLTTLTPLATINEALTRSAGYKFVVIGLLTDIIVNSAPPSISGTKVAIVATGATRNLTFGPNSWTTDTDGAKRVVRFNGAYDIGFNNVNIINNVVEPTVPTVFGGNGGYISFGNASYSVVSSSARPLFQGVNLTGVFFSTVTFANANAAGKFLAGVASNGDPNLVWPWRSNSTGLNS